MKKDNKYINDRINSIIESFRQEDGSENIYSDMHFMFSHIRSTFLSIIKAIHHMEKCIETLDRRTRI